LLPSERNGLSTPAAIWPHQRVEPMPLTKLSYFNQTLGSNPFELWKRRCRSGLEQTRKNTFLQIEAD
jgi:hypothetical protein